ncbi:MAG: glycosyltransferase [Candidatus Kapaibacterium sp.]
MIISVVTPNFNCGSYIESTIRSVLLQEGGFYIDYIIIDGASTDNSLDIIKKYGELVSGGEPVTHKGIEFRRPALARCKGIRFSWISEPDSGMYDAINKGFELAAGQIYAYINADDVYNAEAFRLVNTIFHKHKGIHWIKGRVGKIDARGEILSDGRNYLYSLPWIKKGIYGRKLYGLQQEGMFWRPWLWKKSGGFDTRYRLAGDFYLWRRFADFARLYSVDAGFAWFRAREGQLSSDRVCYDEEMESISPCDMALAESIDYYLEKSVKLPATLRKAWYMLKFNQKYYFLRNDSRYQKPVFRPETIRYYEFLSNGRQP